MPRFSFVVVLIAVAALVLGVHDLTRGLTVARLVAPATAPGVADGSPDGAPEAAGPDAETAAGEEKAELHTADLEMGTVVVSADGATLYHSDRDGSRPSRSNCVQECAAQWPPLWTESDHPSLEGIDPALVGVVLRPDGHKQVTLAGWPLYKYAPDMPGEAGATASGGLGTRWPRTARRSSPSPKSRRSHRSPRSGPRSGRRPGWCPGPHPGRSSGC